MGSTGGRSEGQPDNEVFPITPQATLRSHAPLLGRNVALMPLESLVERMDLSERGSSPSVDAEGPLHVKDEVIHAEKMGCPDLRSKKSIWQNNSLSRQSANVKGTHRSLSVPSNVRPRQQLRLPSFKSLGITPLYPDALLTPPDEASLMHWTPSLLGMSDPPINQPPQGLTGTLPQATMPKTPVISGSVPEESNSASSSAPAAPLTAVHKDEKGDGGSASSGDEAPETPSWIEYATHAIGTLRIHVREIDGSLIWDSVCCCCIERHQ